MDQTDLQRNFEVKGFSPKTRPEDQIQVIPNNIRKMLVTDDQFGRDHCCTSGSRRRCTRDLFHSCTNISNQIRVTSGPATTLSIMRWCEEYWSNNVVSGVYQRTLRQQISRGHLTVLQTKGFLDIVGTHGVEFSLREVGRGDCSGDFGWYETPKKSNTSSCVECGLKIWHGFGIWDPLHPGEVSTCVNFAQPTRTAGSWPRSRESVEWWKACRGMVSDELLYNKGVSHIVAKNVASQLASSRILTSYSNCLKLAVTVWKKKKFHFLVCLIVFDDFSRSHCNLTSSVSFIRDLMFCAIFHLSKNMSLSSWRSFVGSWWVPFWSSWWWCWLCRFWFFCINFMFSNVKFFCPTDDSDVWEISPTVEVANHSMYGRDLSVKNWSRPHFAQRECKRLRSGTTHYARPSPPPSHARAVMQQLWNGARFWLRPNCIRNQRRPISLAWRPHAPINSWKTLPFRRLVWFKATPCRVEAREWACVPFWRIVDTNVVSIASCVPPHNGRPSFLVVLLQFHVLVSKVLVSVCRHHPCTVPSCCVSISADVCVLFQNMGTHVADVSPFLRAGDHVGNFPHPAI